jgi:hypothetical protein
MGMFGRCRLAGAVVVIVALVLGLGAASARPHTHRHDMLTARYDRPDGVRTYHWDQPYDYVTEPAQISFTPPPGARFVHLESADDSGEDVMTRVTQAHEDGSKGIDLYYCVRTWTGRLVSSQPVEVRVYGGACTDHTIAVVTQGTVTAMFPETAHISEMPAGHQHH